MHLPGLKVFGAQPFQPRVINVNQVSSTANRVLQGEIDNNLMSTKIHLAISIKMKALDQRFTITRILTPENTCGILT